MNNNEYHSIFSDQQISNMRIAEEKDYWQSQAIHWKDVATALYNACKESMIFSCDPMMDYEDAFKRYH